MGDLENPDPNEGGISTGGSLLDDTARALVPEPEAGGLVVTVVSGTMGPAGLATGAADPDGAVVEGSGVLCAAAASVVVEGPDVLAAAAAGVRSTAFESA